MFIRPLSLNQPVGTRLGCTVGPVSMRNWFNTINDPAYSITISSDATGAVALQGTNDVALRSPYGELNPTAWEMLPTEDATWTDIQASTDTTVTGTWAIEYKFIQIVITTQGSGTVGPAYCIWN